MAWFLQRNKGWSKQNYGHVLKELFFHHGDTRLRWSYASAGRGHGNKFSFCPSGDPLAAPERERWRAGGDRQKTRTFDDTTTAYWNLGCFYAPASMFSFAVGWPLNLSVIPRILAVRLSRQAKKRLISVLPARIALLAWRAGPCLCGEIQ